MRWKSSVYSTFTVKIMSTLKTLTLAEVSRIREMLDGPPVPTLVSAVERARQDWQQALQEMDHIDGDLTEYVIFKVNACERRYIALLEQAKKEGITAWSNMEEFVPANEICPGNSPDDAENTSVCTG
ncbi:MAG: YaaL family protein [Firmicutes bacterium]|nr:YaaL family protein [Bacillota bacterium]